MTKLEELLKLNNLKTEKKESDLEQRISELEDALIEVAEMLVESEE